MEKLNQQEENEKLQEERENQKSEEVTSELLKDMIDPQNPEELENAMKLLKPAPSKKATIVKEVKQVKEIDEEEITKAIINLIEEKEREVLRAVRAEAKQDRLTNIKSQDIINYLGENPYEINKKSVMDVINSIDSILNVNVLKGLLSDLTSQLFAKGQDDIEKQTKELIKDSPDTSQMAFLNNNFLENIKGMNDDLKAKIQQQLRIAITTGEGISATAQRIKSVFQVSKNRAETIARTEVSRIENFGQLDAAKKSGAVLKKYLIVTRDNRTSNISKAMDRKYGEKSQAIPLDQNFRVVVKGKSIEGPAPPFHPNERDVIAFTSVQEMKTLRRGTKPITDEDLEKKSLKKRLEELQ